MCFFLFCSLSPSPSLPASPSLSPFLVLSLSLSVSLPLTLALSLSLPPPPPPPRSPSLMMRFGSHDWLRYFIPTFNQALALIPLPGQRTMFPSPVMNWPDRTALQKERGARAAKSQTPALRASRKEWNIATYTLLSPEEYSANTTVGRSQADRTHPLLRAHTGESGRFRTSNAVFAILELRVFARWVPGGIVRVKKSWDFLWCRERRRSLPRRQTSPSVTCFGAVFERLHWVRAELSIDTVTLTTDRVPW